MVQASRQLSFPFQTYFLLIRITAKDGTFEVVNHRQFTTYRLKRIVSEHVLAVL